jgi:hypothetical protein
MFPNSNYQGIPFHQPIVPKFQIMSFLAKQAGPKPEAAPDSKTAPAQVSKPGNSYHDNSKVV